MSVLVYETGMAMVNLARVSDGMYSMGGYMSNSSWYNPSAFKKLLVDRSLN